jgi:hypothetical protein
VILGAEVSADVGMRDLIVVKVTPNWRSGAHLRERRAIFDPSQPGPCLGLADR